MDLRMHTLAAFHPILNEMLYLVSLPQCFLFVWTNY